MEAQLKAKTRRSRGRPRSGRADVIESELLDGALRAFLHHGYGGTSLTAIVKTLGISKTTLYSRYKSKAALFEAIITQQNTRLAASTALQADGTPLALQDGLLAYAIRSLEMSLEGDLLQVNRLITSESHRFPELGMAAAERTEHGIRQIADFIARHAVHDSIPCRDPAGIAAAFIFMLRGWYVNVMLTNEPVSKTAIKRFATKAVHALMAGRAGW